MRVRQSYALAPTSTLLSPLVILFELPALTEFWVTRDDLETPASIPVLLSLSFSTCVVANVLLLGRLMGARDRLLTWTTIFLLSIHTVLNCVGIGLFATRDQQDTPRAVRIAFVFTILSMVTGLLVAILLCLDGIRTNWYQNGGISITEKQRSLNIAFSWFTFVVIIGTVSYRFLIADLNFIDALYFTIQSVVTTGFGDIFPATTGARVFSMFFNAIGIISFAIVVIFVRSTFLENVEAGFRSREEGILRGLKKRRVRIKRTLTSAFSLYAPIKSKRRWNRRPEKDVERDWETINNGSQVANTSNVDQNTAENDYDKVEVEIESEDDDEADYEGDIVALKKERQREIGVSLLGFSVLLTCGAGVFSRLEGWNYFDAFYFSFTALSTVGYGDFAPKTMAGRAFFCVWVLAGAPILTILFTVLADAYSTQFRSYASQLKIKFLHCLGQDGPTSASASRDFQGTAPPILLPSPIFPPLPVAQSATTSRLEQPALMIDYLASPIYPQISTSSSPYTRLYTELESELAVILLSLISDLKDHAQSLIDSNINPNFEGSSSVKADVRALMKRRGFKLENWYIVENSDTLMRYLYLRRMRANLTRLKSKVLQSIAKHQAGPPSNTLTPISSSMACTPSSSTACAPTSPISFVQLQE